MVPYLNWQESAAHNRGHLGSTPSGTTNAKAMCGAWLAGKPVPGRPDPVNPYFYILMADTPERRGRGGRNPAASPKAEQCALRVGSGAADVKNNADGRGRF